MDALFASTRNEVEFAPRSTHLASHLANLETRWPAQRSAVPRCTYPLANTNNSHPLEPVALLVYRRFFLFPPPSVLRHFYRVLIYVVPSVPFRAMRALAHLVCFIFAGGRGGAAQLGYTATYIIGTLSLPGFIFLFYAAIKKGKAEVEEDDAKFGKGRW